MQLFLFKLGKIWKTLRQEGLFRGAKRIWNYLKLYLQNVIKFKLSGDILIIGTGVGDVGHFRIFAQAEEFNHHGLKTETTFQDNPFLLRFAEKFSVFILVRPIHTPKMAAFFEKLKRLGKTVIFDTDDLVFDANFMHQTESYRKMNALEKKQYEKGIGEEILEDPSVRYASTTTTYLQKELQKHGKEVFLNPDKITLHELEVAEKSNREKTEKDTSKIKLGYFSGTMSHNRDFATITGVLLRLMEKYPQVELMLVGPLEIENRLNRFPDRIRQLKLVSRDKHYANLKSVDINLIPLTDDPFSQSKAELKFFEAGIVKVPSVAVANETYESCIRDGEDGFLARSEEEWFEKLEKLILDQDLRREMGEKAYQKSLRDYTVRNSHNESYYAFLKSLIN